MMFCVLALCECRVVPDTVASSIHRISDAITYKFYVDSIRISILSILHVAKCSYQNVFMPVSGHFQRQNTE